MEGPKVSDHPSCADVYCRGSHSYKVIFLGGLQSEQQHSPCHPNSVNWRSTTLPALMLFSSSRFILESVKCKAQGHTDVQDIEVMQMNPLSSQKSVLEGITRDHLVLCLITAGVGFGLIVEVRGGYRLEKKVTSFFSPSRLHL